MTFLVSPGAIVGSSTLCAGATSTYTDGPPGGTWVSSNTTVATVVGSTGVLNGLSAGTSVISYVIPDGCYATQNISVNPLPAPISGPNSICLGSIGTYMDAISGGAWTSTNTAIATIGTSTAVLTGVGIGTATIYYTLGTGFQVPKTITVLPTPTAIIGSSSICQGLSTTFTDATTGGIWTSSNTTVAIIGTSSSLLNALSAGTTTLTYSLSGGCSATKVISVVGIPTAITGIRSVCVGSTSTLGNTIAGGTWSSSNTLVASVGSATGVVSGIGTGTAVITYSTGAGCNAIASVTVLPTPAAITGSGVVCVGSAITLTDATTGGRWTGTNAYASIGSTTGVVTGIGAGTATVTYTIANGCIANFNITVLVPPSPITGTPVMCAGNSSLLANATTGGVWTSAAIGVATVGSTTGLVSGVRSGTTIISYTVGSSCPALRTVTINPAPANISGHFTVCAGSNQILVDATPGGTWSSSPTIVATIGTSGILNGVSAGTATITYRLSTGCLATKVVTVYPMPFVSVTPTLLCGGVY